MNSELQGKIFEYDLLIVESHLDTLGHVNNAIYIRIFEDARWELITKNGFGLKEVHELKQSPIILDVTAKFLKEVKNREKIKVTTQCTEYSTKIGKLKQILYNEKGEAACEAIFTFAFFDMNTRKIISPSEKWLQAIGMKN